MRRSIRIATIVTLLFGSIFTFATTASAGACPSQLNAVGTEQGCSRVWDGSTQNNGPRDVVPHEVSLSRGVTGLPSTGNGGPAAGHASALPFVIGAMASLTVAAYEIKRRA